MKILLTGGTGFIGQAFLGAALEHGHEVLALVRPGKLPPAGLRDRVRWATGSMDAPPWEAISEFGPDSLVHAAWITTPGAYWESSENHQWLEWSRSFIRRLRTLRPVHVVALGSCAEYQLGSEPMSETLTPIAPSTNYGRCKDALRCWLDTEVVAQNSRHCWARVFYPYGPGEDPARLCSVAIRRLRLGLPVENRAPHRISDYIFIEDLATALVLLVESGHQGTINLGTGHGVSVEQIVRAIATELGVPPLIDVPAAARGKPLECVVADATRLRALGWRPQVSIAEGVTRLIEHLKP